MLKTDYKDYIPASGAGTLRKYQRIDNGDGTVSFQDVTEYAQTGDKNQASVINTTNAAVNEINTSKGEAGGYASLDEYGHIPKEQLNLNFAGQLIVHVTTSDGGSVGSTRVRITQAQLGANFIQPLDALGSTTFELLENHTYSVVLVDYPGTYYGGAESVTITGGETQEITIEMTTEPDIIGWDLDETTGTMVYTDGAANWTPAYYDDDYNIHLGSFEDSWLLRGIKPCMLKNGVVQYYLNPNDYSKKVDGTDADITSGNDGDVMIEFSKIYYKVTATTDVNSHHHYAIQISQQALSGFSGYAFMNNSTVIQNTIYIGAYIGAIIGSSLRSISGVATSTQTADTYFNLFYKASNNGNGYMMLHFQQLCLLRVLFSTIFKTLNFKSVFPNVVSNSVVNTGNYNAQGLFNKSNTNYPKLFGVEGVGSAPEFIQGLMSGAVSTSATGNIYYFQQHPYSNQLDPGNSMGGNAWSVDGMRYPTELSLPADRIFLPWNGSPQSPQLTADVGYNVSVWDPMSISNHYYYREVYAMALSSTTNGLFGASHSSNVFNYSSSVIELTSAYRARLCYIPI